MEDGKYFFTAEGFLFFPQLLDLTKDQERAKHH